MNRNPTTGGVDKPHSQIPRPYLRVRLLDSFESFCREQVDRVTQTTQHYYDAPYYTAHAHVAARIDNYILLETRK